MMVQTQIMIVFIPFSGYEYNHACLLTGISRGNKDQCMFLIYLEAISVSNNKGTEHMCDLTQKIGV